MENEEKEVEITELPEVQDGEEDKTDWKAEALKQQGIAKRFKTKLEKSKEVKAEAPEKKVENKKSEEVDYALESYLIANGIKEDDERELFNQRVADGQKPKDIFGNKFFQQDLTELRNAKTVKAALPPSSNRSGSSASNTVDYWKAKVESGKATVLDIPDVKLRRQVVNARMAAEKDVSHFTTNPFGHIGIK